MKTSRHLLILAMAIFSLGVSDSPIANPIDSANSFAAVSTNPLHAARLRKLHLVRPDLINYPVSFDVVC